jgi:hypothetical protein
MPIDKVLARRHSARQFTHQVGGWTFGLRTPSKGEFTRAVSGTRNEAAAQHQVVLEALQSWTGVVARDLDPGIEAGGEPVAFSLDAASAFLDEHTQVQNALLVEVMRRYDERYAAMETAQGNSAGT